MLASLLLFNIVLEVLAKTDRRKMKRIFEYEGKKFSYTFFTDIILNLEKHKDSKTKVLELIYSVKLQDRKSTCKN